LRSRFANLNVLIFKEHRSIGVIGLESDRFGSRNTSCPDHSLVCALGIIWKR
jgi:hypothetical protein